jgi:glucose-6-phosphate 1-epimerase
MPMTNTELASRFRIPGTLDFVATEHGLIKAMIVKDGTTGELYLQGAHLTAWQPRGARPVIFTSSHATFAPGKAIRGGIPVIFPWFGPHPTDPKAPQHGFARTASWQLDKAEAAADAVTLELSLAAGGFALTYQVAIGATLRLDLAVRNISESALSFEVALHSYFAVSDVERVAVSGLQDSSFIDKTANMRREPPAGGPMTLTGETDRVYLDVPDRLMIDDGGWDRRILIEKTGAASTIVWNPWAEKAAAMADLGVDNWRGMLCVETGNVADNRIHLPPGGTHEMTTRIALDGG